jgi:serine acetyltransferase
VVTFRIFYSGLSAHSLNTPLHHAWQQGFHALQVYRVAHALWHQGRQILALALQSRVSEVASIQQNLNKHEEISYFSH